MRLLIRNGLVIDPSQNINEISDLLVEGECISKVAKNIKASVDKTIDAANKIIMPGIVDMHVHLREPGREDKETILTGTRAALRGGVTSLLAMPNTDPAIDSLESLQLLKSLIQKTSRVNVFACAAITIGRQGKDLTDVGALKKAGAIAVSDDGSSVDDAELFLKALKKAKAEKILVICHSEDKIIANKGIVNLGIVSTALGLRGASKEAEFKRVERDILLAEKTGCPIHIAHISCRESLELIARAKKKGISVSCETAPHYFALSEEALMSYDTNLKINPPLRSREDVAAIKEGLKSGVIDAIASDHAPHTENEKDIEFDYAEFGTIGLETELAVSITELINPKILDWPELVKKLCFNPAKILGIDKPGPSSNDKLYLKEGQGKGTLKTGSPADIIIVNPDKEWVVEKQNFLSKSKNSCFIGKKLKGAVEYTILGGEIVYQNAK